MYFLVNLETQAISAHKKLGDAARKGLSECNLSEKTVNIIPDPVAVFNDANLDIFMLQNISDAFESISESDDTAAQELAASYKQAIDDFYKEQ